MQIDASAPPLVVPGLAVERVGLDGIAAVEALNLAVFGDTRIIHRLDRDRLTMLVASLGGTPVGFKVGYAESQDVFYSAKGGVLEAARRRGIARLLLERMADEARAMGFARFAFDTFPNKHPGMTVLGLAAGFTVTAAGFNSAYRDYRLRFEKAL